MGSSLLTELSRTWNSDVDYFFLSAEVGWRLPYPGRSCHGAAS